MSRYIGKQPVSGNFVKLDAITTSATATYALQSGGSAFTPQSVNQMIVSLNGVIQAPTSAFTLSGSNIVFDSALTSSDVIDFILVLGDVNDIGTPSDNTVATAKIVNNAVTADKLASTLDLSSKTLTIPNNNITKAKTNFVSTSSETGLDIKGDGSANGRLGLLCSAGSHGVKIESPDHSAGQSYTIKLPDNQIAADKFIKIKSIAGSGATAVGQAEFADAGGGMWTFISSTDVTSDVAQVDFTSFSTDYSDFCIVIQNLHGSSDDIETRLRIFNDAGSIVTGSFYQWSFIGADTGTQQVDSNGSNQAYMQLGRPVGNASHESSHYEIILYDVHDTGQATATEGWKHMKFSQNYSNSAGEFGFVNGGGFSKYNNSGNYAITGARILMQAGNIASGRFSLYGRKHS